MNHSRCCANDNGTRSGRTPARTPTRALDATDTRAAKPAGVDAANTARNDNSTPNTARTRDTNRTASNECPPRRKKSSSTPTTGTPNTCANAPHTNSSTTPDAPRPLPVAYSGAGRAWRSTLPFTVTGSSSSTTTAEGAMYSGKLDAAAASTAWGNSSQDAADVGTT